MDIRKMKDSTLQLETISLEDLVREAEERYGKHWSIVKLRRCLGCGEKFNARDMRTHSCAISWKKRIDELVTA
jgi:hypothetical protein